MVIIFQVGNLSCFKNGGIKNFNAVLRTHLIVALNTAHIPLGDQSIDDVTGFGDSTLSIATEQYVLLIDEYDAPLTASYDNKKKFKAIRNIIYDFYLTTKRYAGKFRFVFITGVCYYAHVSMFSGFNVVTDLTLDSTYGALLGYTQEELESNFSEYLDNAVTVLNAQYAKQNPQQAQPYTHAQLLVDLKKNYDGYCFDEECQYHVYNPWSIIKFLESPHRKFKDYWFVSGSFMPTMLAKYIKNILHKASSQNVTENTNNDAIINNSTLEDSSTDLNLLLDLNATVVKQTNLYCQ